MNNEPVKNFLQDLCLTTAFYSLLCLFCKIFSRRSEPSSLQDVTPGHKVKIVTKGLEETSYFTLMA
jgi:hypothetical protein